MMVICDCGEWEVVKGEAFCGDCLDILNEPDEWEGMEGTCASCESAPPTLFGVCDDCYDEAYNTRASVTSNATTTQPWVQWNRTATPAPPPYQPPSFAEEATHHPRITKRVAVSA